MRSSWHQVWQSTALAVASRSRCTRAQVGAVVVTAENRIVAVGYNGPPAGYAVPGSCEHWCERGAASGPQPSHYLNCLTVHAEMNALLVCDRRDREGGTLYVTSGVCWDCAKSIANSGLAEVRYRVDGADRSIGDGVSFMRVCGIKVFGSEW